MIDSYIFYNIISNTFVLYSGYAWLGIVLFMAFETLATFSYNIVYIYTSELFPTYTRNSMHAICSAMGRVGSLIAPQTPLLVIKNEYHSYRYLSIIILNLILNYFIPAIILVRITIVAVWTDVLTVRSPNPVHSGDG